MYTIKTGNQIIYDSTNKDTYPAFNPELTLTMNEGNSLNFVVLPDHPLYSSLSRMKTFVTFQEDDEELFYGRIIVSEKDLYGQKSITCEGAIAFFLDSEMEEGEFTETIPAFLARCIASHNSQVESEKRFTLGQITADKAVEIDSKTGSVVEMKFKIQGYSSTKSVLDSLILSKYGGFFRIRPNPNGPHFLDYISNFGRVNTQRIKIAENIIDKVDHISGEDIFTILRPLGKQDGDSGTKLTIETLSQSAVTIPNAVLSGNTIRLTDAINQYGSIIHTEYFSEIDDAATLLKAAEDFITRRGTQLPSTSQIGYVEFHLLNPEVMAVRVGDTFSNIEGFPGQTMTVGELHITPDQPETYTITFKNAEELNTNNPSSTAGSLSASYASQCTHMDYVYKYIREEDDKLLLIADQIELHALQLIETANQMTTLIEDVEGLQGNYEILVGKVTYIDQVIDTLEGSYIWMNQDNIAQAVGSIAGLGNRISTIEGSAIWQNRDSIVSAVGSISALDGRIGTIEGSAIWQNRDSIVQAIGTISALDGRIDTIEGSTIWQNRDSIVSAVGSISGLNGRISTIEGSTIWQNRDSIVSAVGSISGLDDRIDAIEGSAIWQNKNSIVQAVGTMHVTNDYVADSNGDYYRYYDSSAGQWVYTLAPSGYSGQKYRLEQNLHVNEGVGLKIDKNVGGSVASFGVYDQNNLTAGYMISMINGQSVATIQASKINLEGYVKAEEITAESLNAKIASIPSLATGAVNAAGNIVASGGVIASGLYIRGSGGNQSVANAIKSITNNASAPSGQFGITYTTLGGSSQNVNFSVNCIVSASVSGNTLTLTYSNGNTVNFSKAAPTVTLSGSWSGNPVNGKAYKVTASTGETDTSPRVNTIFANGDPTWASDNKGFTQMISVKDENHIDIYGNTLTFDTTTSYNAGASSVTLPSNNLELYGQASYNSNSISYTVPILATLSNGNVTAKNFTVMAGAAYDAGKNSVVVSSLGNWSNGEATIMLSNGNTATGYLPTSATWDAIFTSMNSSTVYCTIGGKTYTHNFTW